MTTKGIGAQLWLFNQVHDEAAMNDILAELADAGYAFVETMHGHPPFSRAPLDALGLPCYAVHVALSGMPDAAQLVDHVHGMGARVVCVSGLLQWLERGADDYRRSADALNEWGARLARDGIALHYHNHDFEFAPMDGPTTGMDLLLPRLDGAAVELCYDMGWHALAGGDPMAFLHAHGPRVGTLHLRDFRGKTSVPLGAGDVDLLPVIDAAGALPNLRAVLVEQDPGTATPLEDMRVSRRWLEGR